MTKETHVIKICNFYLKHFFITQILSTVNKHKINGVCLLVATAF